MKPNFRIIFMVLMLLSFSMACKTVQDLSLEASPTPPPTLMPTRLPPRPVVPGEANPDEPVFIRGNIPFTSPFFLKTSYEPFVLLEDEAGFVKRDREFEFPLTGQFMGPADLVSENNLVYSLSLPSVPQGTLIDVDNNGKTDAGVQVFAVAYWSNIWGGPFLERRDGTGWSTAYTSTIVDPNKKDEIVGGILIVWALDDEQGFPTGFGADGRLFTEDDPTGPIPAGYNLVDLNQEPFRVYKEAEPSIDLNEGVGALKDYSKMGFTEAFDAFFKKASKEYPFTVEKKVDWDALYKKYSPRVANAKSDTDFYIAIRDFTWEIPDGHIGGPFNAGVFQEERGGGFGLVLTELSDGKVIATKVLPNYPAESAGIQIGAEIATWNGEPVEDAIAKVVPYFGPFSTDHTRHLQQVAFLTRVASGDKVKVTFKNPGDRTTEEVTLSPVNEYDSFLASQPSWSQDKLILPLDARILDSGLAYIRLVSFLDDTNLTAHQWDRYMTQLVDQEIPGLIIDLRINGGGSTGLALDMAGYFYDEEVTLYSETYYNEDTEKFEYQDIPAKIKPGPKHYKGNIAVLVSPDCISACEGFAYALAQTSRAIVVGHYPTAGAFGGIGLGQYKLPGDQNFQIPTSRTEAMDGKLVIEGTGVVPSIIVPVTEASALDKEDTVLEAAINALLKK